MLKSIKLTNFKCFEHLDLRCAPLTLLCGLNGMGKSSVIQALLVLQASRYQSRMILNEGNADVGTPRDVLYEGAETDSISFEIRWADGLKPFKITYVLSEDRRQLLDQDEDPDEIHSKWFDLDLDHAERAPDFYRDIVYVGAERIGPRKIYDYSEALERPSSLGARGEHTLSYLSARRLDVLDPADPRCIPARSRRFLEVIDRWLQEVTPGTHLGFDVVKDADALIAGFSFDRPGDTQTRRYRATNVGFGLSYVLPVLTALLVPKGHLCLIENPEAHLHPRGQAKVAELAVRAAIAGVQVIVETHSDHFLDGVRIAVREQLIRPEDVAVHYFERDGGKSVVVTPEIDADGRLSQWPAGFFDQHDDNLARLLAPRP